MTRPARRSLLRTAVTNMHTNLAGLLVLLALSTAEGRSQAKRLPIIDMHMHARTAHHYGPDPGPLCAPVERMPTWDPLIPFGEALGRLQPPCARPVQPAATDAEVMGQTIAVMKQHNIIGMLGGKPDLVAKWMTAAPGRFIPGLDFRLDREGGTASAGADSKRYEALSPQAMRQLHRNGSFAVLGEVLNQYGGITPDDPRMVGAITSFRLRGRPSKEDNQRLVAKLLDEHGIFTVARSGVERGDCVRVTPALYNTPADLDKLAAALMSMAG